MGKSTSLNGLAYAGLHVQVMILISLPFAFEGHECVLLGALGKNWDRTLCV